MFILITTFRLCCVFLVFISLTEMPPLIWLLFQPSDMLHWQGMSCNTRRNMQVHLRNLSVTSDSKTAENRPQWEDLLQYNFILLFINIELQTKGLMSFSSFVLFFKSGFSTVSSWKFLLTVPSHAWERHEGVCELSINLEWKNKRIGRGLMTEISDAAPRVRKPQWHLGATQ